MDSQTHVEFADKLLGLSRQHPAYAVASLFPQIDRYPHVFHRMYAHTVFKAARLAQTGLRVLSQDGGPDNTHAYEVQRFQEEREVLVGAPAGRTHQQRRSPVEQLVAKRLRQVEDR